MNRACKMLEAGLGCILCSSSSGPVWDSTFPLVSTEIQDLLKDSPPDSCSYPSIPHDQNARGHLSFQTSFHTITFFIPCKNPAPLSPMP